MSGDGGFYDGWSGVKQLQEGDPALVRKEKGNRYSLTTQVHNSVFPFRCVFSALILSQQFLSCFLMASTLSCSRQRPAVV